MAETKRRDTKAEAVEATDASTVTPKAPELTDADRALHQRGEEMDRHLGRENVRR